MPLVKSTSDKALRKNIATEYRALRKKGATKKAALKQAIAIAYSVKRRAGKKKGRKK
jgi:hypothetical protein